MSTPPDILQRKPKVERACFTLESGHLDTRPTLVLTETGTRGCVFVIRLAFLLERG